MHAKNWRPTIVVFTGNPQSRLTLAQYSNWLGGGRGIVTLVGLIVGSIHDKKAERKELLATLNEFIASNKIQVFPQVLVTPEIDIGFDQILQCASVGPLQPNLAIFGWSPDPSRADAFVQHLHTAHFLHMSLILLYDNGLPTLGRKEKPRIDIWWRGEENGSLMAILSYLILLNREWAHASIRFLRIVRQTESHTKALKELKTLIELSRMKATVSIIDSDKQFVDILHSYSSDAAVVFIGFKIPGQRDAIEFQRSFSSLLQGMPTTLLVNSTGEADLMA